MLLCLSVAVTKYPNVSPFHPSFSVVGGDHGSDISSGESFRQTPSASILFVPTWRSKVLFVLRHAPPLGLLPPRLLPSFPLVARDQLPKVSQISRHFHEFCLLTLYQPQGQLNGCMVPRHEQWSIQFDIHSRRHRLQRERSSRESPTLSTYSRRDFPPRHPRAAHSVLSVGTFGLRVSTLVACRQTAAG